MDATCPMQRHPVTFMRNQRVVCSTHHTRSSGTVPQKDVGREKARVSGERAARSRSNRRDTRSLQGPGLPVIEHFRPHLLASRRDTCARTDPLGRRLLTTAATRPHTSPVMAPTATVTAAGAVTEAATTYRAEGCPSDTVVLDGAAVQLPATRRVRSSGRAWPSPSASDRPIWK